MKRFLSLFTKTLFGKSLLYWEWKAIASIWKKHFNLKADFSGFFAEYFRHWSWKSYIKTHKLGIYQVIPTKSQVPQPVPMPSPEEMIAIAKKHGEYAASQVGMYVGKIRHVYDDVLPHEVTQSQGAK